MYSLCTACSPAQEKNQRGRWLKREEVFGFKVLSPGLLENIHLVGSIPRYVLEREAILFEEALFTRTLDS